MNFCPIIVVKVFQSAFQFGVDGRRILYIGILNRRHEFFFGRGVYNIPSVVNGHAVHAADRINLFNAFEFRSYFVGNAVVAVRDEVFVTFFDKIFIVNVTALSVEVISFAFKIQRQHLVKRRIDIAGGTLEECRLIRVKRFCKSAFVSRVRQSERLRGIHLSGENVSVTLLFVRRRNDLLNFGEHFFCD